MTLHITIQKEIVSLVVVALVICFGCVLVGNKIKKADPLAKPGGVVLLALWFVDLIDNQVLTIVRNRFVKNLAPYIGTLCLFLFLSNILGLFGFNPPTMNYSVTLSLALITWIMIQFNAIRDNGIGSYIHGFFEPIFPFVVPNIFGKIAPLISMSIRLFGNILSGSIIMSVIYSGCMFLSDLLLGLFNVSGFNLFGIVIAPFFHAYFDVFAGFIQMFIFISLTMVFISNELKEDE